ncbi:L-aspartate oxidase [Akkermansiaceae bacterium]|nr:L-aspartate oxidase [Akkermansiaceae bacterium]MDB4141893.1 L-aspartate oxidase [Akkermansiaceae bacterium]MDB4274898.1 L-aspartate oxidase [Akkermansiaceae bacterium]MDB4457789.1 L-aspartate oxidase [Akkermansiaceae bacterium]MDB4462422.1 L-aspartate oxidase [Akkermansiaceae bacterium]
MSDFLVIGSGIAGLSFAIKAAEHGIVTIITKGKLLESNTAWAQGGISAVLPPGLRDPGDNCEKHIADTLDAGGGLCHDDAVEVIIAEAAETIEELVAWGSDFDRDHDDPERYSLCKEGGHSERRILHSKDTTGREIATSLVETMRKTKNITILEDHYAIDLITTGKLGAVTDDRILGAYVLDIKEGRVSPIESPRVILATGGCGKTYLYTTNPDSSTGDGLAMCWRAGAEIANMEFIQFHPTCFYNPAATGPEARSFLVSEAVRGEGAVLVNGEGHQFVNDHDPRGSLAPRDIVARAIDTEIKRTGAPCVYLDVSPLGDEFTERFPFIHKTLLGYGHNALERPIPVVPAAHYQCGGVVTDLDGKTSIRGLFAVGEVACTGLHGANRLASNSLLEGNVMARRALAQILRRFPPGRPIPDAPEIPKWESGNAAPPDELVNIYHAWDELRRTMQDYVSIVRTDNRLRRASNRLQNLRREVRDFYWGHTVTPDILELRNLVATASLIIDSAILRKESRGSHHTLDYPGTEERFEKDTVMRRF